MEANLISALVKVSYWYVLQECDATMMNRITNARNKKPQITNYKSF